MSIHFLRTTLVACLLAVSPWLATSAEAVVETTVGVTYDVAGRVDTVTLPSGRVVSHTYAEGAILETTALDGTAVVDSTELTVLGQPSRTTLAATHGSPGGEILRGYDALGRLASQEVWYADESVADYRAINMQYDAWGFLASFDRADLAIAGTYGYGYDGQGRLDTVTVAGQPMGYTYDASGNLLGRTGLTTAGLDVPAMGPVGVDSANRRLGWTYDAEGRLEEDDRYRYRYDRAGRLAALFTLDGDLVAHYLYDAGGRRVRHVDDTSMTVTTRDLGGGVVDVRELDLDSGSAVEQRESVLHAGQPMVEVVTADGATTYEHGAADRLGNPVVRIVDGQRQHQEYSPYGLQVLAGEPEHRGAHGFTGVHEDDDSGLVYMQARYYDPAAGRFNRPDPARDFDLSRPSTFNLYLYTYANPVNFVDPTGLSGDSMCRTSCHAAGAPPPIVTTGSGGGTPAPIDINKAIATRGYVAMTIGTVGTVLGFIGLTAVTGGVGAIFAVGGIFFSSLSIVGGATAVSWANGGSNDIILDPAVKAAQNFGAETGIGAYEAGQAMRGLRVLTTLGSPTINARHPDTNQLKLGSFIGPGLGAGLDVTTMAVSATWHEMSRLEKAETGADAALWLVRMGVPRSILARGVQYTTRDGTTIIVRYKDRHNHEIRKYPK